MPPEKKPAPMQPPTPAPIHEIYAQRPPGDPKPASRAPTEAEAQAAIARVEAALVARLDERIALQIKPLERQIEALAKTTAEFADELEHKGKRKG